MSHWRLSAWAGGIAGIAAAAALTWLFRWGTQTFISAVRSPDNAELAEAGWLLLLGGVVLMAVLLSAHLHPLITGIPALWFLVRFGPLLLGVGGVPEWYPQWIGRHVLIDANEAAFVITGLLAAATTEALLRPTSPPESSSQRRIFH